MRTFRAVAVTFPLKRTWLLSCLFEITIGLSTGLETHYYKDNSLELAKYVHASLLNHVNSKDRGLFKSRFYVINHTTAPAILVEIGFISSPVERAQLVSESRKQATAKAIAEGINDYFNKK